MAQVQKGTTLKVGFGSFAYTGYIPEDGLTWEKPYGQEVEITNASGDMMTKILMDARDTFTMDLVILDSGGSITPPRQGDTVTVTNPAGSSVACYCKSGKATFIRANTKLTLELVKESSMTYS